MFYLISHEYYKPLKKAQETKTPFFFSNLLKWQQYSLGKKLLNFYIVLILLEYNGTVHLRIIASLRKRGLKVVFMVNLYNLILECEN